MLDSEEAIQAVINEAGTLATEEALKQFDTQGEGLGLEIYQDKGSFFSILSVLSLITI
jgi:hypothetical protein